MAFTWGSDSAGYDQVFDVSISIIQPGGQTSDIGTTLTGQVRTIDSNTPSQALAFLGAIKDALEGAGMDVVIQRTGRSVADLITR